MKDYGALAGRYLKHQKKRTLLTILGVILSTALITGTGTIILSVKNQLVKNVVAETGYFHVAFKDIGNEQARIIRNHLSVSRSCTGRIQGYAVLDRPDQNQNPSLPPLRLLRLYENDQEAMEMLQTGRQLLEGRLPQKPGEIALGRQALRSLGGTAGPGTTLTLGVGNRMTLEGEVITDPLYPLKDPGTGSVIPETFEYTGEQEFTVTGILDEDILISDNYSYHSVVFQDEKTRAHGETFHMLVLLSRLDHVKETALDLAADAGVPAESVVLNTKLLWLLEKGSNETYNKAFKGFNLIVLFIIALATVAVIHNTFSMALMERITQLGVLRCLGAVPGQIRTIIFREAGFICLAGILPGLLAGLLSMKIVFKIAGAFSTNFLFQDMEVIISPRNLLFSALLSLGTVFISALVPAFRAGRLSPMEAVRRPGLQAPSPRGRFVRAFPASGGPWFFLTLAGRNIRRHPGRTATAVFSMMISVVLFVSFGGLLRLSREANVIQDPGLPGFHLQSATSVDEEIYRDIRSLEGVDRVIKYLSVPVSLELPEASLSPSYRQWVENLSGFPRDGDRIAVPSSRLLCYGDDNLDFLESLVLSGRINKEALEKEGSVILVQKGMFFDNRGVKSYGPVTTLGPGDRILLEDRNISLTVAAVLKEPLMDDYNENEGGIDLIVTEALIRRLYPDIPNRDLFIKTVQGSSSAPLIGYLEELTASRIDYSYVDAVKKAEGYTRDFYALALFFYGFMAVIALIGGLNVVNTVSTNLFLRTGELGILQATGMDRAGLRLLILAESLIYASAALILGSLAGSALWFIMVDTVGEVRQTIYQVPWREMGLAAAGLLVIAVGAGLYPQHRLQRTPIIENIRREE